MDDLLKDNLESETLHEETINTDNTESINNLNNNIDTNFINNEEVISKDSEDTVFQNAEVVNSLALTIKKDYSLAIAKNIFIKTLRSTWKIVLSTFTLNFLKFFL